MQRHKNALIEANQAVQSLKRRRDSLSSKQKKHDEQQAALGPRLQECVDTHTTESLEKQSETVRGRMKETEEKLQSLKDEVPFVFRDWEELLSFFMEEGFCFSKSALARWSNGDCFGNHGGKVGFDAKAEKMLVDAILLADGLGQTMGTKQILALANEYIDDPAIKARFSEDGPTESWYKGFCERNKREVPELVRALERGTDCRTLKWFNSENVDWWFGLFNQKICDYGFARAPEPGEEVNIGESVWLPDQLKRVCISDETCVSGGGTRKTANHKRKVLTLQSRLEKNDGGGMGHRRVAGNAGTTQEHITLVAIVSLAGEVGPPVWIFSAENDISPRSRQEIEEVSAKCGGRREHDLPMFNGQRIDETFIGTSKKGGITRDNVTALMTRLFKAMYPDVENKDGKRVLWLTDWHDSRLSLEFIESMRAMGVVMMGWLPNTTSKCQLPDVSLFGPFKSKRDSLEAKWANCNPGKMVNRKAKVLIACQAMAATFTRQRIFQGAKDTGMLPISRKALLAHPSIKDGDVIRLTTETRCAASLLRAAQMTPPPPQSEETAPVVDQQDEGMFDEAPLFATPDRHEQAESTPTKNKVGHSKEYAVARLKTAKLLKDDAMITRINLILKTKGSELKRLVAELVHSQAAAL